MTPQQIIDALQQTSNPIGQQLVREVVASIYRLIDMDVIVAEIRESTGLYTCPATDIPGHIADIIGNLASQNVWLMSRLPERKQKSESSLRGCFDEAIHAFPMEGAEDGLPRANALAMTEPSARRGGLFWPDEQADMSAEMEESS